MFSSGYFWIATYVIGMVVVGYPLAYISLKIWKGGKSTAFSFLLFPHLTVASRIGQIEVRAEKQTGLIELMLIGSETLTVHSRENIEKRAKYIWITMLLWPLRIASLPVLWTCSPITPTR